MADAWALARYLVALAMLLGASVLDLRSRRVPNRYWYPFLAAAAAFAARDLVATPDRAALLAPYAAAAALCLAFYGFWRAGLFGGADAKGLMVLSFLAPYAVAPPADARLPAFPPAFDAVVDGTLLVILLPFLLALSNLLRGRRTFPALLLGYPLRLEEARRRHVWPMHRVTADGKVVWRYWQRPGRSMDATYDTLAAAGMETVWVTPKLPFLVPLTAGWVAAGLVGNLAVRAALRLA